VIIVRLIRLQFFVAIGLCCSFFISSFARDVVNDKKFLEVSTKKTTDKTPNEIKIVSYNIRWRGGDDLKKLIELFKTDKEIGGASIIGLQEVDRNKKRTKNENTIKTIAQSLDMNYAWAAPPNANANDKEEETGVAILSAFPLSDVTRIILPVEGPGNRRRVAIGATLQIGNESVRVYSVHAETRITPEQKIEQLKSVIDDFEKSQIKNGIVLGDFNTIFPAEVENTTKLFQEKNFSTPFSNKQTTWTQFLLELKLDWLWLRGLQAKEFGINRQISFSDHFPLWVKASFNQTQTDAPKKINEKLRKELLQMEKTDQEIRNKEIEKKYQDVKLGLKEKEIDLKNTKRLKEIIAKYGFPYSELVGKEATNAAFIIIQHSPDHAFQEEMLPYIEKGAKRGDIPTDNYALLVDRTRIHKGLLQLYGTQASFKDSKLIVDPIEDEEKVDERRKALGLPPLEEYLKMLSEMYKMPVERKQKQN
jgi:endonuclease/exonuclease/phosphatase family metal-dependent hydrolase